ncbi:hypothetical protein [Ruminococcus sp. Marseille-P6503]|uniref:hypothetical protein n=1 Tax=Ruminococcus sp. Marseille-P6503 TaxID=2364796 RepID=UPI000F532EE7|nr:hypothetical protein [Ruminococcus sp. Marseille-P6503]
MPKQIKKDVLQKGDKKSRVAAVVSMICAFAFAAAVIALMPSLVKDESPVKASVITAGFAVFTASCIVHAALAFLCYKREGNFTVLFQGVVSLLSALLCLINFRFMAVLLLSGLKMDSAARKLVGDQTMTEFVGSQTSGWVCMVVSAAAMIILGILGIIRLAKR